MHLWRAFLVGEQFRVGELFSTGRFKGSRNFAFGVGGQPAALYGAGDHLVSQLLSGCFHQIVRTELEVCKNRSDWLSAKISFQFHTRSLRAIRRLSPDDSEN